MRSSATPPQTRRHQATAPGESTAKRLTATEAPVYSKTPEAMKRPGAQAVALLVFTRFETKCQRVHTKALSRRGLRSIFENVTQMRTASCTANFSSLVAG